MAPFMMQNPQLTQLYRSMASFLGCITMAVPLLQLECDSLYLADHNGKHAVMMPLQRHGLEHPE